MDQDQNHNNPEESLEQSQQEQKEQQAKEEVKKSSIAFYKVLWRFLRTILSIREGTNPPNTIAEIKENIVFKGPSIWILICSVFIASIGLNVNSTAVVIGAMLISPLMGPIMGIGLSIGTYDFKLLTRSLKNFAIMVAVSLLTSYIYFQVTPLSEVQSELFARTKPTLLDVLLAVFGGLAGIIAGSRDEKSNVVPGVAIATALMPPLCTAGYGLATGRFDFFLGAFYLFLINSVFIGLSTTVAVTYLKFPKAEFLDAARAKRVKTAIVVFAVLVLAPSTYTFYSVVKESLFRAKADTFLKTEFDFPTTKVMSQNVTLEDGQGRIEVFLIGEILQDIQIDHIKNQLADYELEGTLLQVNQAKDASKDMKDEIKGALKGDILEEMYKKSEQALQIKDERIKTLEKELNDFKRNENIFEDLREELKIQYPELVSIAYANMKVGNFNDNGVSEQLTFIVQWNNGLMPDELDARNNQLKRYLAARLKVNEVKLLME